MSVFKCKMCGGDMDITEKVSVSTCPYCKTAQTVSFIDDEKKINLYNRANKLRMNSDFDKASGVYESIVVDFPEEAEAYWGLVLCKYGIEYVDDPATAIKIPTCHRSSFESVMDDENFEQVMENSDIVARSVYRKEAKQIEDLRKNIIEVSSKEEPYDIFICYKETDEYGNRTIDSVIAQDVYDALTEKGYKVFFSRITLEDKLGQEYEPYIFAALNSAKVMLAFGTDYEYYNAVWVKNEWSRFLQLIAKGERKVLIPCFKNIDAYDMPKEFSKLQSQDMGKVGAIQDLLRGIGKVLGINNNINNFPVAFSAESSALVQRGNMALEDGDFKIAENFFERALDANPADAQAYLGEFLVFARASSIEDLKDKIYLLDESKEFKRAEQFANNELANKLRIFREKNEKKIEQLRFIEAIKQVTVKKTLRDSLQLLAQCNDESYTQACVLFDVIANSNFISPLKAKNFKRIAESEYFVLKYLKEKSNVCSFRSIISASKNNSHIIFQSVSLDQLVEAGYIEKHNQGYCLPGVKEKKERLLREAAKHKQRKLKQKTAYNEACAEIELQIRNESDQKAAVALKNFDFQIRNIYLEIDKINSENEQKRHELEHKIYEWDMQKKSLGIFKGKEKKELQKQIDEAQNSIFDIPSKRQVVTSFQPKLEQIDVAKNALINKITKEVRSQYTMPKMEDFIEQTVE